MKNWHCIVRMVVFSWVCWHGAGCSAGSPSSPASLAPARLGIVSEKQLKEISGLAASRRFPGVLWAHNDGPDGRVFALRTNGQSLAVCKVAAPVEDVEDIAIGPGPMPGASYLYLGDVGDNKGERRMIQVVRFAEPEIGPGTTAKAPGLISDCETFRLRYPKGKHDAEALLVDPDNGDIFVVTKEQKRARVFAARRGALRSDAEIVMELVRELPFPDVSGGDISPDGKSLLLRREGRAFLWTRGLGEDWGAALGRPGQRVAVIGPPLEPNGEAAAWRGDGRGYYTLSEGPRQPIYFFHWEPSGALVR